MFGIPGAYKRKPQENVQEKPVVTERVVNNEVIDEKKRETKIIRVVTEKWAVRNENSEIKRIWNDLWISGMHAGNKKEIVQLQQMLKKRNKEGDISRINMIDNVIKNYNRRVDSLRRGMIITQKNIK